MNAPEVEKAVFAVCGADLAPRLRDPALHARLADAGVGRVQVNVPDDEVAGALRIDHLDEPIGGFVAVWDGDLAQVARVLDEVGTTHGYAVDERRRLDPPEAWDGSRAEALANVAVLRRPAELDRAEWLRRWMVEHTGVAIRTQATSGYVQNVVREALTPGAPRIDGFVEELFAPAAVTDLHAFYGSGGDPAELDRRIAELMTSVARFGADRDLDLVPTGRYLYDLR